MQSSESMFQNYLRYYLKLSTETMSLYTYNCAESRDRLLRISEWNVSRVLLLIPLSAFILLFLLMKVFAFCCCYRFLLSVFFATENADVFYCCSCCCCFYFCFCCYYCFASFLLRLFFSLTDCDITLD